MNINGSHYNRRSPQLTNMHSNAALLVWFLILHMNRRFVIIANDNGGTYERNIFPC